MKRRYWVVGALIIVLALVFFKASKDYSYIFTGVLADVQSYCMPTDLNFYKNGTWKGDESIQCIKGVWVIKEPPEGYEENECLNDATISHVKYLGGDPLLEESWDITIEQLTGSDYCQFGKRKTVPSTCGSHSPHCETGETKKNCWFDCWLWEDLEEEKKKYPYLMDYCRFVLQDSNLAKVDEMIGEIEGKYDTRSPGMFMKAAAEYTYDLFPYSLGGGRSQCGDRLNDILDHGSGNCVDYTYVTQLIGCRKGIPVTSTEGCVSFYGWRMTGMGYAPLFQKFAAQGHTWNLYYAGENRGLVEMDTTTGIGPARESHGYHIIKVGDGSSQQCYISDESHLEYCNTFK